MSPKIYVTNNFGKRELLSRSKILNSAKRSGASLNLAKQVADEVIGNVKQDISSAKIYAMVKKILMRISPPSGMKYTLKEAIVKLGPSGYWFEKYVSEVLKEYGYETKINQIVKGHCTDFEVDVLLWKEAIKEFSFGECKYHNQPGSRVSVSVILENYASFIDLKEGRLAQSFLAKKYNVKRTIITNTKFTSKAVVFANCYGVSLLGWKYPKDRGLEYYIDGKDLYPITIFPSVDALALGQLYEQNVLLAKQLLDKDVQKKLIKNAPGSVNISKLIHEAEVLFDKKPF